MTQYTPLFCVGEDKDTAFLSFILPLSIINTVGVTMLVLIAWTLVRELAQWSRRHQEEAHSQVSITPL